MGAIEAILREPAAQAIGWALLHFVWQGALVGILAGVALRMLRGSAADVRYVVAAISLSVMATLPVVTAFQAYRAINTSTASVVIHIDPRNEAVQSVIVAPERPVSLGVIETPSAPASNSQSWTPDVDVVESWLPFVVAAWLAGVISLTLRLLGGWIWVQRMKSHGATMASSQLQAMIARLSKRLHIYRRIAVLQSTGVDVPTVIGALKPVILLPVSALAGLSTSQIEAILAHEMAHIRRHDYLVNLLQTLLETVLFYHPAVWWLSRRIRDERENCCDDLAVSLCGDPVAYARALADLEEHRGTAVLAMAATGGPLLQRVRRLVLGAPAPHAGRGPVWLAALAALLLTGGVGAAIATTATERQLPPVPPVPPAAPVAPPAPIPPVVRSVPAAPVAPPALSSPAVPFAPTVPVAPVGVSVPALPVPAAAPAPLAPVGPAGVLVPPAPPVPLTPAPTAPVGVQTPAAPPAPPAPPAPSKSQRSQGHISWSNNGEKLEIRYEGEFEFTDDDTDIKKMSPGGQLRISDGGWFRGNSVEISADPSGNITRKYWVGSSERPFEPEGRKWLAQKLPRFVRQSGIGAKARAARIFKAQGASGLLAEISRIEGSWAKKVYFTELFGMSIDAATVRQALEQAGREISSDYELATLLIDSGDRLVTDESTRSAYFDATRNIDSDYEMRRVYSAALKRGPLSDAILASVLDASRNIDSDYELASLLIQIARQQPIDPARMQFFAAMTTLQSDYEHRRVLSTVAARPEMSPEVMAGVLSAASKLTSDYEAAEFLLQVSRRSIEGPGRAPFFAAVEGLDSSYERGRVLQAVLKRTDLSAESLSNALRAASTMSSGYELSQVLQTAARHHQITGATRDLYVKTAEKLGDYEQSQVLAALVRNERGR